MPGKPTDWASLLSDNNEAQEYFQHHETLYSTTNGKIQSADPLLRLQNAAPAEFFYQNENVPYLNCTRAIDVFKPSSEKIDNVVIVNDGVAYLTMECMEIFNKRVEEGELSPNTAFIFVTPLPGLSLKSNVNDPKASMPGMGERTVEYEHEIEQYVDFLREELLPKISKSGLTLPTEPENRVMIGSSLSGTASIYIGSKHSKQF